MFGNVRASEVSRSAVIVVVVMWTTATVAVAQASRSEPPNIDTARTVLTTQCSVESTRPRSADELGKLAASVGLRENDGSWTLATTDGELRVFGTFDTATTSCWIILFPRGQTGSISDAVLTHLLRDARYASVDGDMLEIGLAPIQRLDGGGTSAKSITITLAGSRLVANRTVINWTTSR